MPPKTAAAPAKAPVAKAAAKAAPAPKAAAPAPKAAAPAAKAAAPAAPKKVAAAAGNSNGVYVKNWGQGSVADASAAFAAAGKVSSVQIRRGKYALVFFETAAAVKKAVDSFNGKSVNGSVVIVTAAKTAPKADKHDNSSVVFVGPIFRENTTRKQLFEFFAGSKIVKLRRYEHNYAYVYFESAAVAQKVIKDKNGASFHGKALTVKPSTRSLESEKARNESSKQLIEIHTWKQQKAATH
jgi:RNA recognition motif-containing protein